MRPVKLSHIKVSLIHKNINRTRYTVLDKCTLHQSCMNAKGPIKTMWGKITPLLSLNYTIKLQPWQQASSSGWDPCFRTPRSQIKWRSMVMQQLGTIWCRGTNYISNILTSEGRMKSSPPPCDWRRPRLVGESLPVVTACHPRENGVLAWMVYAVIGLWLSGPGLQDREAVVSVISSTWMLVGGPGGPDRWHNQAGKRKRKIEIERQMEEGARGREEM